MIMIMKLSSSNNPKLLCFEFLKPGTLRTSLLLRRLLSSDTTPLPGKKPKDGPIIAQLVQLLQNPHQEWDKVHLHELLFSSSVPSPGFLYQVTRRLSSSSQALKFTEYLRSSSPSSDIQSLSATFQAVFELASRGTFKERNLFELYKTSREWRIPLTSDAAYLLLRLFGMSELLDELLVVFNELEGNDIHHCRVLINGLLDAGRVGDAVKVVEQMPPTNHMLWDRLIEGLLIRGHVGDAFKVLEEMMQPNAECDYRPGNYIGFLFFSSLLGRDPSGRCWRAEEIVDWVLKLGGHGIFPNSCQLRQLITGLCRDWKSSVAWDLLFELMKLGANVEVDSFNALLTGLERDRSFNKINEQEETRYSA